MTTVRHVKEVSKGLSTAVVVVTGGAHGIGARAVRQMVARGARVAIVDRDGAAAERIAATLGGAAIAVPADVTSAQSMVDACAAVVERFGGIDAVVANAGIGGPGQTIAAVDPVAWRDVIDINVVGVFHTLQAALPHVRRRRGYILVISSIGAVIPGPLLSGYIAAKTAVESVARSLRIETAADGVAVGIGYFGLVDTGLADQILTASGLGVVMGTFPGGLGRPIPVDQAAAAITAGVARRARRVYAPRWVPLLLAARTPLFLVDRVLAVLPRIRRAIADADGPAVRR